MYICMVCVQVCEGDYVSVTPEEPNEPLDIARVMSMWQEGGEKLFHASWLNRGGDTVLGETSDPCELFLVDVCEDNPLGAVVGKVNVTLQTELFEDWRVNGGEEENMEDENKEDGEGTNFFVQKFYDNDTARFEDLPAEHLRYEARACQSCVRKNVKVSVSGMSRESYASIEHNVIA